jgi:transposase
LCRSRALHNFDQFNAHTRHPNNKDIPSQRSSELFMSIEQESIFSFINQLREHHTENEYLAYDITSISSYSGKLKQVKYGYNKENELLAQFNLAFVFGEKSNIPFFYKKMAGNMPDSKTVKDLLLDLKDHGFKKLKLVMYKGNSTIDNINAMIESKHDFLLPVKLQLNFIKGALSEFKAKERDYNSYNVFQNVYSETILYEWKYQVLSKNKKDKIEKSKTLYMHLYFNPTQRDKDIKNFYRMLHDLEQELQSGNKKKSNEKKYDKYFITNQTEAKIQVIPKIKEIMQAVSNFGYLILLGSEKTDSIIAIEVYRNKDVIEKAIGTVKEMQGFRRPLVSNERSLEGKLFVEYIALILLSYLKKQMQITKLNKYFTVEKIFSALDTIECFEKNNKIRYSEILEKQKFIYSKLDVNPPS